MLACSQSIAHITDERYQAVIGSAMLQTRQIWLQQATIVNFRNFLPYFGAICEHRYTVPHIRLYPCSWEDRWHKVRLRRGDSACKRLSRHHAHSVGLGVRLISCQDNTPRSGSACDHKPRHNYFWLPRSLVQCSRLSLLTTLIAAPCI